MSELNRASVAQVAKALAGGFYGTTVTNVLSSRNLSTTYTNTTGRAMVVSAGVLATGVGAGPGQMLLSVKVNGALKCRGGSYSYGTDWRCNVSFEVLSGETYQVIYSASGGVTAQKEVWTERGL